MTSVGIGVVHEQSHVSITHLLVYNFESEGQMLKEAFILGMLQLYSSWSRVPFVRVGIYCAK
jgi:hypothetical protein